LRVIVSGVADDVKVFDVRPVRIVLDNDLLRAMRAFQAALADESHEPTLNAQTSAESGKQRSAREAVLAA
jgi:hypothetical protein